MPLVRNYRLMKELIPALYTQWLEDSSPGWRRVNLCKFGVLVKKFIYLCPWSLVRRFPNGIPQLSATAILHLEGGLSGPPHTEGVATTESRKMQLKRS